MTTEAPILEARGVRKTYKLGRVDVPVLHGIDLQVQEGEWLAIVGASGSGKSTLLHLLGALDTPDRPTADHPGEVLYRGKTIARSQADHFRSHDVGFVFQFYHLLPELSVIENVLVGAMVGRSRASFSRDRRQRTERAEHLLEQVGLAHRIKHRPNELSGGERQRVALARAVINNPAVLLADEPTGNLDRATGASVLEALTQLRAESGLTMVMVTHDETIADDADRTISLVDGRVAEH